MCQPIPSPFSLRISFALHWTCYVETRIPWTGIFGDYDQNAIVCESHPEPSHTPGMGKVVFDWFLGRPAGQDYSAFVADYPIFSEKGPTSRYSDCSKTDPHKPMDYKNLISLLH